MMYTSIFLANISTIKQTKKNTLKELGKYTTVLAFGAYKYLHYMQICLPIVSM